MTLRPQADLDHHSQDHHSQAFVDQGAEQLAELRARQPVGWSRAHGGFWAVTRYSDVAAAARLPTVFSSARRQLPGGTWTGGSTIPTKQRRPLLPLEQDGPDAVAYRRIVTRWTSRSAVDALVRTMEDLAHDLLDRVIEQGRLDFIADLGNPLPALVIMRILGLELTEWERFAWPFHAIESVARDCADYTRRLAEFGWIQKQLEAACEERRAHPRQDAISDVATASVNGELIPIADCVGILMTFIGGGVDTTTATLAHILRHLSRRPADRKLLIEAPHRVPVAVAVEEFLRCFPPVRQMSRTVAADTDFHGVHTQTGERVLLSVLSANLDESQFSDADRVDLPRAPNPQVSFGLGVHRCAGLNVARAELEVLLRVILERMPDFTVDEAAASRYNEAGDVDGWVNLPATFTPGRRRGGSGLLTQPAPPAETALSGDRTSQDELVPVVSCSY